LGWKCKLEAGKKNAEMQLMGWKCKAAAGEKIYRCNYWARIANQEQERRFINATNGLEMQSRSR
jgi:hypothetical protein